MQRFLLHFLGGCLFMLSSIKSKGKAPSLMLLLTSVLASERPAALLSGGFMHAAAVQNNSSDSVPFAAPRAINRTEVMARAQKWVEEQVPYCQCTSDKAECCGTCKYCSTYRCDCSGYVSYTWDAGQGYTTHSIMDVATDIHKDHLRKGDAMLCVESTSGHVVLFGGWADSQNTSYHAYQEPGCHNTVGPHHAYNSIVPYPMSWVCPGTEPFHPIRYNHITD